MATSEAPDWRLRRVGGAPASGPSRCSKARGRARQPVAGGGAQQPRASLPAAGTSARRNQGPRASARDPHEEPRSRFELRGASAKKNLVARAPRPGRTRRCRALRPEALDRGGEAVPPNHPFIGDTLESLGQHCPETWRSRQRRGRLYARSIASYEGSPRPNDPGLAHPLRYLASC